MNVEYRFIEPLDVLFLRGNQLFGDPGSYGESLIPPWPSVAAGAIRSRMLADDNIDLTAFAKGDIQHPTLGKPNAPGPFTLAGFHLAQRTKGAVEILLTPPADLVISKDPNDNIRIQRLNPQPVALPSSYPLPLLPVLAQGNERSKPASGYWLTQAGWAAYLNGKLPTAQQLVPASELWKIDSRVGIGMNADTRSVDTGKLFSSQAVALKQGVGFLAAVQGAQPPEDGLLRLGGDGRAASVSAVQPTLPEPDYAAISKARRCRLILISPGLFPAGWTLPGTDADHRINLGGITAKLVSAAVARAEVISGWDLASRKPKDAQRVAPTGSVYWLDELDATPEALRKLAENGLWSDVCEDTTRRAEGFNRFTFATWQ